jgi:hypothetical protein
MIMTVKMGVRFLKIFAGILIFEERKREEIKTCCLIIEAYLR